MQYFFGCIARLCLLVHLTDPMSERCNQKDSLGPDSLNLAIHKKTTSTIPAALDLHGLMTAKAPVARVRLADIFHHW